MRRLLILALLCVPFIAGCQNGKAVDPTVQLTLAVDGFDTTIVVLTAAKKANLIPAAWNDPIRQAYVTAKAALEQMQINVASNNTKFQSALSDFSAAMSALVKYRQQVQTVPQPTPTLPTKGIPNGNRSPARTVARTLERRKFHREYREGYAGVRPYADYARGAGRAYRRTVPAQA
jgi:hypothetical protein